MQIENGAKAIVLLDSPEAKFESLKTDGSESLLSISLYRCRNGSMFGISSISHLISEATNL